MKIIEPSAALVGDINPEQILKHLEQCGRVSHKSQAREDSAEHFIRLVIKRGHESVLEHASLTFRVICDRGVMAEFTRHRLAAFTVESTRYVKYDELEVIAPPLPKDSIPYRQWHSLTHETERIYSAMVNNKIRPEIARAVLPNCLKTEIYVTANLREWRHILKLRCAPNAHPQMRQIANQIRDVLIKKLPVIVEDISDD